MSLRFAAVRPLLASLGLAWFATLAPQSTALAAPPASVTTQVPGYYRASLGDFDVTALYDGFADLPTALLKGARASDIQALLASLFVQSAPAVQTAVNAYLIHTGEHLVLIDTGAAQCFGPTLGQTLAHLRAAGYQPQDVDTVLLTHLHPDHLCGLLDAQGQPAFANATVWAAQADADFWLSPNVAQAAPKEQQGTFALARQAVAPYQGGRSFQNLCANRFGSRAAFARCPAEVTRRVTPRTTSPPRGVSCWCGETSCTRMRCSLPTPR